MNAVQTAGQTAQTVNAQNGQVTLQLQDATVQGTIKNKSRKWRHPLVTKPHPSMVQIASITRSYGCGDSKHKLFLDSDVMLGVISRLTNSGMKREDVTCIKYIGRMGKNSCFYNGGIYVCPTIANMYVAYIEGDSHWMNVGADNVKAKKEKEAPAKPSNPQNKEPETVRTDKGSTPVPTRPLPKAEPCHEEVQIQMPNFDGIEMMIRSISFIITENIEKHGITVTSLALDGMLDAFIGACIGKFDKLDYIAYKLVKDIVSEIDKMDIEVVNKVTV